MASRLSIRLSDLSPVPSVDRLPAFGLAVPYPDGRGRRGGLESVLRQPLPVLWIDAVKAPYSCKRCI
jgi:hypothetical protein